MINYKTLIKRYAPNSLEVIEQFSSLIEGESQEAQWDAYSMLVEQILPSYEFDVITVDSQGKEIERKRGKAHYFTEDLGDGVGLDMVYIPGGEAVIGTEKAHKDEIEVSREWVEVNSYGERYYSPFILPPKTYKVKANPFFMSKYPITVEQWDMVAEKTQYRSLWEAQKQYLAYFQGNKSDPMSCILERQIIDFCEYLSQKTGILFRTPIIPEWEYACRAGTRTAYHFGDTITPSLANFNNDKKTPVGSFSPNRFGLYDLHGNICEWCGGNEYVMMGIFPDLDRSENNLINLDCQAHSSIEIEQFFHNIRRHTNSKFILVKGGGYSSLKKECLSSVFYKTNNNYQRNIGFRLICS